MRAATPHFHVGRTTTAPFGWKQTFGADASQKKTASSNTPKSSCVAYFTSSNRKIPNVLILFTSPRNRGQQRKRSKCLLEATWRGLRELKHNWNMLTTTGPITFLLAFMSCSGWNILSLMIPWFFTSRVIIRSKFRFVFLTWQRWWTHCLRAPMHRMTSRSHLLGILNSQTVLLFLCFYVSTRYSKFLLNGFVFLTEDEHSSRFQ